jgi:dephospho-CoA kinase
MPYRIGLTGNIACGKSTVGELLVARGAEYVDADRIVHQLMEPGRPEFARILARFGRAVADVQGRIDRRALGALVWNDPAALRDLEEIVVPPTREEIRRRLAASTAPAIVVDAIKLIESGLHRELDALWVVTCSRDEQIRRLMEQRGMTHEQATTRIDMQSPQEEKVRHATVVIENSGPLDELERQVEAAWHQVFPLPLGEG